jgi:hypothetical protein
VRRSDPVDGLDIAPGVNSATRPMRGAAVAALTSRSITASLAKATISTRPGRVGALDRFGRLRHAYNAAVSPYFAFFPGKYVVERF